MSVTTDQEQNEDGANHRKMVETGLEAPWSIIAKVLRADMKGTVMALESRNMLA
jgi:hypothetical protein